MASRLQDVIQRDTRANQPLATDVAPGTLYYVTDESVTERSSGVLWEDYSDGGGSAGLDQLTGDVTAGPGTGSQVATIANDAVTFAKMQNIATDKLLGRDTALSGNVEEIGLSADLQFDGAGNVELVDTAVTPGSYTNTDLTVDDKGRITAAANGSAPAITRSIGITIDGAGSPITAGIKGDIYIPYTCVIQSVTMLADQVAGGTDLVIDIWKNVYGSYPPVNGDSITAAATPTIATGQLKSQDNTLTGWGAGKNITAGDTLRFNVDTNSDITRVTLVLEVLG
jgi:hypothetical protein